MISEKYLDEKIEIVKLTDFGISIKLENENSTIKVNLEGTLSYLAPEYNKNSNKND